MDHFAQNRQRVMQEMAEESVMVIFSAAPTVYSHDVDNKYRQNSDFHYLTGFTEQASVAVLAPGHEHPFTLFVQPKDQAKETWTGIRCGVEGATEHFGANKAFSIEDLEKYLPTYLENTSTLYYHFGANEANDRSMLGALRSVRRKIRDGIYSPRTMVEPGTILHEMRLIKQGYEVDLMRKAGHISAMTHCEIMKQLQPGMNEYEIEALIDYQFKKNGATGVGYGSIVGSGVNGTILHYHENDCVMKDGDLLLVDAGCEYQFYNADITRTTPVNGKFTKAQKEIYNIVLEAQKEAITMCKPGNTFNQIHDKAVSVIAAGLKDVGLIKGSVEEIIEKELYTKFYMHKTGHWIGVDVHDKGDYKIKGKWRVLNPGMVTTVEPGIYIGAHLFDEVPEEFQGIGIRIEDDILITEDEPENLTREVPKEVEEIEALMGR